MWPINKMKVFCIAFCCSLIIGCATPEQNQQLFGAAGGAALGCLAGALITGDTKGCAAGAAAGAVVGWGAVKISQYHASQTRSAEEDRRIYGLTKPVSSTTVKIRKGTVSPAKLKPGEQVVVVTDYSLMAPKTVGDAQVMESWVLKRDGKSLTQPTTKTVTRTVGGYSVDATIPIPRDAPPGTYVVETKVQAGTSYDVNESVFVIES